MTVLFIRQNESDENGSYPLFGPFGIAFYDVDEGNIVDNTTYAVKIVLSVCLSISMVLSLIGNVTAIAASSVFFWLPYCVMRVMTIYPNFDYEDNQTVWKIVNFLCYNGYVSSAVNPILYSLMSRKFRKAFNVLLKGGRTLQRSGKKISLITQKNLDVTIITS
ncbi:unnamed protein product [Arctia plantaginis]|uniref:G-protein coupled receptors family 1 profile domain-containing protein n=1 Tax=Arctia plantaginis TaxID=874455 RepID=A0A8S1AEW2_ARCPL|nr:unnamed protein product [Arctia plantaginis]CAB3247579.1 unnamed protein product [Arctia plantaginis]